jgi:hypothetical protein
MNLGINTTNETFVIPKSTRTSQIPTRPAAPDNERRRPAALDSIRTEDRRRSGGALWFFHLEAKGDIADYLKSQGYRFSENKGWWKK